MSSTSPPSAVIFATDLFERREVDRRNAIARPRRNPGRLRKKKTLTPFTTRWGHELIVGSRVIGDRALFDFLLVRALDPHRHIFVAVIGLVNLFHAMERLLP